MLYSGMAAGVGDRYTHYMPEENLDQYMRNTSGNFHGVGIEVFTTPEGEVTVSRVMEGKPAEQAGMKEGEVIVVDGTHKARPGTKVNPVFAEK
jgi:carboxyl-terminal processing protease